VNAEERARLRALVDQTRRERAAREALVELEMTRFCEFCGSPIPPERVGRGKFVARFCEPNHRQYAYKLRKRLATA
jgi:RNA polymerase-binding transcription factor DksA